jgi:hypothetical protein
LGCNFKGLGLFTRKIKRLESILLFSLTFVF